MEQDSFWNFSKENLKKMIAIIGIVILFSVFSFINIQTNIRYSQLEYSVKKMQQEKKDKILEVQKYQKEFVEQNSIHRMSQLYEIENPKQISKNSNVVILKIPKHSSNY